MGNTERVFFLPRADRNSWQRFFVVVVVVLAIYTQAYVSNVCSLTHCLGWHIHIWMRSIWDGPQDAVNPQRISVYTQPYPGSLQAHYCLRMQHCIILEAAGSTNCCSLTTSQSQALCCMLCGLNQFILRACTPEPEQLSQCSDWTADWTTESSGFCSQDGKRLFCVVHTGSWIYLASYPMVTWVCTLKVKTKSVIQK